MTTCLYSRAHGVVAADTQYTTGSGHITRCSKIEKLKNGWLFCGSGYGRSIDVAKEWAANGLKYQPEVEQYFSHFLDEPEERGFECFVIKPDGSCWMIDEELAPYENKSGYVAVGSGACYAIGALEAGASPQEALGVAAKYDPNTSAPFDVLKLES